MIFVRTFAWLICYTCVEVSWEYRAYTCYSTFMVCVWIFNLVQPLTCLYGFHPSCSFVCCGMWQLWNAFINKGYTKVCETEVEKEGSVDALSCPVRTGLFCINNIGIATIFRPEIIIHLLRLVSVTIKF